MTFVLAQVTHIVSLRAITKLVYLLCMIFAINTDAKAISRMDGISLVQSDDGRAARTLASCSEKLPDYLNLSKDFWFINFNTTLHAEEDRSSRVAAWKKQFDKNNQTAHEEILRLLRPSIQTTREVLGFQLTEPKIDSRKGSTCLVAYSPEIDIVTLCPRTGRKPRIIELDMEYDRNSCYVVKAFYVSKIMFYSTAPDQALIDGVFYLDLSRKDATSSININMDICNLVKAWIVRADKLYASLAKSDLLWREIDNAIEGENLQGEPIAIGADHNCS